MNNKIIIANISQKISKSDKNGNEYLILKLENEEVIFVFASKVKEERWAGLEEGKEYNFTVEEGNNGSNLLVDFTIET